MYQTPPPYNQNYNTGSVQKISSVMKQVYIKMTLALVVTALVSLGVNLFWRDLQVYMIQNSWLYWGLMIAEILLVISISARINKMSGTTATLLFYLFAVINGLALSIIVAIYTPVSLFKTFLITAGTFGAMSVYGYFTSRDLTSMGTFLRMALWGLIICIIVNIFWANSTFDWIISILGVLIFVGLTAWDTQQIRNISEANPYASDGRLATLGALTLYLDFINLFLYLLRFFGSSRD